MWFCVQENRDPRKLSPLLELLIANPLTGEGGSFGDSGCLLTHTVIIVTLGRTENCLADGADFWQS